VQVTEVKAVAVAVPRIEAQAQVVPEVQMELTTEEMDHRHRTLTLHQVGVTAVQVGSSQAAVGVQAHQGEATEEMAVLALSS